MSEITKYRCDVGPCEEPAVRRVLWQPLLNPLRDQEQQFSTRRLIDACEKHMADLSINVTDGSWEWTDA